MKLWLKLSLISASVLLFVVAVCNFLLSQSAGHNMIQLAVEQAESEEDNLSTSFSEMVKYYLGDKDTSVSKQSIIKYCFSRFANDSAVLVRNNETLYSHVSVMPEKLLPLDTEKGQQVYLHRYSGRNILIIGNAVSIESTVYSIYVVKDITTVYNDINTMVMQFAMICGIGIAAGALLIIFLIRYSTRPLKKLKDAARRMAVGQYIERINIRSKDEVCELAKDFNMMADTVEMYIARLKATLKNREFFIGGLTHEFKTPITAMIIHLDTLLMADLSSVSAKNSLAHINRQCRWLERLTQKLLKLITLEEDINIHEESVKKLFEDVESSISETFKTRNTPLIISCETDTLEFDFDLMKSLLINLVDNASKASEPGQTIKLRAYDRTIEVSDCGRGIPKQEIEHITEPFYIMDKSRNKKLGGSGLGLALVKRIVEAHNAELIFESEVGIGTAVKVIFHDNKTLMAFKKEIHEGDF